MEFALELYLLNEFYKMQNGPRLILDQFLRFNTFNGKITFYS